MIFVDDSIIKVGGVILPGIVKSLEIKTDARVEEQEVEGNSAKPKQVTGYEDAKITLEIALEDGETKTKESKLKSIQSLFRKSGQAKPQVYDIVNEHTAIRGIKRVIFKSLTTKEVNKKSELTVNIEFWEYVPINITATKKSQNKSQSKDKKSGSSSQKSSSQSNLNLNKNYSNYLSSSRGAAPKIKSKTSSSPARDTASGNAAKNKLSQMPY
ncbi:hypothetical protein KUA25_06190 [Bacteroidales bacterium MSK.15.36]|nr:hypothetical protein [Bacteroidales bacterium MSK.15.36]